MSSLTTTRNKNLQQLALCSVLIALSAALGMIKLFHLPFGGSVTLLSMLAATLCGYYCGAAKGIISCLALGLLNFILVPYVVHPVQVALDYFLGYGALGLSGLVSNKKNGLVMGYIIGVTGRFICSFLAGCIFYADYAPEGMNYIVYSFLYQLSYIGPEALITLIIINIPVVKNSLKQLKKQVN